MAYPLAMLYVLGFLPAIILFAILGYLRYMKGVLPLRESGDLPLPGFPHPRGLVSRLDGVERKRRDVLSGGRPLSKPDGSMVLPDSWEHGEMTAGRMAAIAHTWGMCRLAEEDPQGARSREAAVSRPVIIMVFTILIAMSLIFLKRMDPRIALMMASWVWAFLAFAAVPTQYREWKARDAAQKRLKEIGLWPRLSQDGRALEACLSAMAWCRVAGFRRVLPR